MKLELESNTSFTNNTLYCRVQCECMSNDFPLRTPSWITSVLSLCPTGYPFINHMLDSPGGLGASAESRVLWWETLDTPHPLRNTTALK